MSKLNEYSELLDLCNGAQHRKDVRGWQTLREFDRASENKDFNAHVYKKGNRIVLTFAGTYWTDFNDLHNDFYIIDLLNMAMIPFQYGDAERLYNQVRAMYPDAQIESMGYSLGATISNLLSHRTGIKSTVIAPIGSRHIAEAHPQYFRYGDSNITTYGRIGDFLFYNNFDKQSGNIYIVPELSGVKTLVPFAGHLLDNYRPYDIYQAKLHKRANSVKEYVSDYGSVVDKFYHLFTQSEIGKMSSEEFELNEPEIMQQLSQGLIQNLPQKNYSGYTNPLNGSPQIFFREDIGAMSGDEYSEYEASINAQLNSIGIPTNYELETASRSGFGTVYVRPYTRSDGTPVKGYYRSK